MDRARSESLDSVIGEQFDVLDHGFIRVIDYMGTDEAIVQAARVSYGKGTKSIREDANLIRYLMRNRHTSPFEQCEIKLHWRVPLYLWQQILRHRTASINQTSARYSEVSDIAHKTPANRWRPQSQTNKQSSEGYMNEDVGQSLTEEETEFHRAAHRVYRRRLDTGVAREQARKDLPQSTYTEAYWKIDLHNLLHFLALRMDHHAQLETRMYANIIGHQIVSRWVPMTWAAFQDYRLNSMCLTALDKRIIQAIHSEGSLENKNIEVAKLMDEFGWTAKSGELRELKGKLKELGISYEFEREQAKQAKQADISG